jgi:hypothetical protein
LCTTVRRLAMIGCLAGGAGLGVPEMMRRSPKQAIPRHDFFGKQQEQREGGREGRRWLVVVQREDCQNGG